MFLWLSANISKKIRQNYAIVYTVGTLNSPCLDRTLFISGTQHKLFLKVTCRQRAEKQMTEPPSVPLRKPLSVRPSCFLAGSRNASH